MALDREKLRAELVRDEGEVLHAYKDSRGYWTIADGYLIDPRMGAKPPPEMTWPDGAGNITERCSITGTVANRLLDERIDSTAAELDRKLPWWRDLADARSTALANMAYNLGVGNAQHGLVSFAATLELIHTGQFAAAADHLRKTPWEKQVHARADRLIAQIETGVWQ